MSALKPVDIIVEGWFYIKDGYPDIERLYLDKALFKYSAKKFEIDSLHVTDIRRIYGSMLNPVRVTGITNLNSKNIELFFIRDEKVSDLNKFILKTRNEDVVVL
jgi:hypothetical protein